MPFQKVQNFNPAVVRKTPHNPLKVMKIFHCFCHSNYYTTPVRYILLFSRIIEYNALGDFVYPCGFLLTSALFAPEGGVETALPKKCFVHPMLNNLPLFEHEYHVGVRNSRKPVGDHDSYEVWT